ncbi:MAG: 2-oxoacid:acceptor oxidoreductase subunit alpha [Desulfobulbaceae bacterium]|jgi:2-oxoglutarate ferredoxin oxidoreductase subunit alpha|nr:2-oxoacid:acceptor oxidoreductase subunit alpha [Desulfobulbaceae bacterium]
MDYTIQIAGEAGQGLQTTGASLVRIFCRLGYHVFSHQDYMSRVRGGHNFYRIRVSDKPLSASRQSIHILVALDRDSIDIHRDEVHQHGVILYDPGDAAEQPAGAMFLPTPFARLAEEKGGRKIMANSVAVGAVLGLFDLGVETAETVVRESLESKSDEVIDSNLRALRAGRHHVREHCTILDNFRADPPGSEKLMLINGTQAIGFGAVTAGCRFYSAYPMTPSTGVMVYLAGKSEEHNIIVEQAEDEISAINMALGASYAGVRAMTGTSGGGFALMTEGLSLAGMTETPIVICEMQRPGPATGFPTRTEQSDLMFVIYGGHGEFPRVVLTPGTPEQAFLAVNKAFDLAEKYQIPAFVQGDQYLADCEWTCAGFDFGKLSYRDYRLRGQALRELTEYRRYAFTENGISPLAVPGESEHLVVVDSDEHDEDGHIVEDGPTRIRMVEKRLHKKLERLRGEISPPELYGAPRPETVLVGYGSTYGVMRETVDLLAATRSVAMLHFSEVYPFPRPDAFDYLGLLRGARHTLCVELNATGQFARLLRAETGFVCSGRVNRYDGRPFTTDELAAEVRARLEAE